MNFRNFLPSSLFARMAIILLAGLLTAQLASLWLQWGERATVVSQARGQHFVDRMAEAILSGIRKYFMKNPPLAKSTLARADTKPVKTPGI